MVIIILSYILLLLGFFAASGFIFRQLVQYGYLSPRFKIVVIIFSILSVATIIFSIFLILSLNNPNGTTPDKPDYGNNGDLNF